MEFASEEEANAFTLLWKNLQERAKKRAIRQLQDYQEHYMTPPPGKPGDEEAGEGIGSDLLKKDATQIMEGSSTASESEEDLNLI
mmetsp:Transcript_77776/g.116998  ORF Transcript_77776/g.116998 Transcript_77776/m.116998 type:complete len:85 (-) Transcript_77776:74-328(-)